MGSASRRVEPENLMASTKGLHERLAMFSTRYILYVYNHIRKAMLIFNFANSGREM